MQSTRPGTTQIQNSNFNDEKLLLTASQQEKLNFLLPVRYKFEDLEEKSSRTRRPIPSSELPSVPSKRPTREKDSELLTGKPESFKKCYRIFQSLKQQQSSRHLYLKEQLQMTQDLIPDDTIDLSILESKLLSGEYLSAYHFSREVKKMLSLFFNKNSRNPEIFQEIFKFSQLFESSFKTCENLVFSDNLINDLNKKVEKLSSGIREVQKNLPQVKLNKEKKMTNQEKKQLCLSIKKLDPKYLGGVVKIVRGSNQFKGNELEFDLEQLPNKVCRELEKYLKQCLQFKAKKEGIKEKIVISGKENLVKPPAKSESEEESSSSSSESEEELPGINIEYDIWDKNQSK